MKKHFKEVSKMWRELVTKQKHAEQVREALDKAILNGSGTLATGSDDMEPASGGKCASSHDDIEQTSGGKCAREDNGIEPTSGGKCASNHDDIEQASGCNQTSKCDLDKAICTPSASMKRAAGLRLQSQSGRRRRVVQEDEADDDGAGDAGVLKTPTTDIVVSPATFAVTGLGSMGDLSASGDKQSTCQVIAEAGGPEEDTLTFDDL